MNRTLAKRPGGPAYSSGRSGTPCAARGRASTSTKLSHHRRKPTNGAATTNRGGPGGSAPRANTAAHGEADRRSASVQTQFGEQAGPARRALLVVGAEVVVLQPDRLAAGGLPERVVGHFLVGGRRWVDR